MRAVLYKRRKRLRELAEREAGGESFWTPDFNERCRNRLFYVLREGAALDFESVLSAARLRILEDEGALSLTSDAKNPVADFITYFMQGTAEDIAEALEAVVWALLRQEYVRRADVMKFIEKVEEILLEERVQWEFVHGQMVPFESRAMHTEVVAPAITLLGGLPGWDEVERAYLDALDQLHKGHPDNAVTDATTALQKALEALGCSGNRLGPLIASAREKGLIAAHDVKLLEWASADRVEMGDPHASGTDKPEDAWLTVQVVGAIILRLTKGGRSDG